MILIIECFIMCLLFSVVIIVPLYKNPVGQIMSYPKKIREKVESLPQYETIIRKKEKRHILIKVSSVFIFSFILAIIAFLSGAKTCNKVFNHVFIIFFVVNLYDLLIMDLLIFRNVKSFRIPGTEDMDKEYKECMHHIKGFFLGIGIGIVVAFLSMIYVQLFDFMKF